jgi:hypothetical protein
MKSALCSLHTITHTHTHTHTIFAAHACTPRQAHSHYEGGRAPIERLCFSVEAPADIHHRSPILAWLSRCCSLLGDTSHQSCGLEIM